MSALWPRPTRVHIRFDERGNVAEYELRPSDEECAAGWRAMMLAPSIEVCRALLVGESVPLSALRAEWVERFGLREDQAA